MLIRSTWIALLVLLFFYLLRLQLEAVWSFTIDDTYITLRYAKQWAEGYGLVWNRGDVPVEGYSNFAYLVFARCCYSLHIEPVQVFKIIGSLSLCCSAVLLFCLSRLWVTSHLAMIPAIWLLAYRGEIIWSVSGLETTFYEAVMLAAIYFLLRLNQVKKVCYAYLSGFFLALMSLTRPEGIIIAVVFLAIFVTIHNNNFANYSGLFGPIIFLVFPYFLWRLNYFGYVFPNPVYCKGVSHHTGMLDWTYLKLIAPFAVTIGGCLYLQARLKTAFNQPFQTLFCQSLVKSARSYNAYFIDFIFLSTPSVLYLVFCIRADPIVAFDNRLFLPAFASCLPLTLVSLTYIFKRNWHIYVCSLIILLWIPKLSLADYRQFAVNPVQGEKLRTRVASWITQHISIDQSVVLADCGLIPYLQLHTHFIDSYCLNNLSMAHSTKKDRYIDFCHQVLKTQPAAIILTAWHHQHKTIYTPADACLAPLLKNHTQYDKVATYRTTLPGDYYQYVIYKRNESRSIDHA